MGDRIIKILFVEDVPTDTELAERELRRNGIDYVSSRVDTKEGYLYALKSFVPDIVVSDYMMPMFDGMTALLLAKEADPFLPFIVLTGSMNEDTAVSCMKAGASDYVIKEHMSRLAFAVNEAIERRTMLEKAARQDELLRQSEERYRSIFVGSNVVMLIIDPLDTSIVDANDAAVGFYGWSKDELLKKKLSEINTLSPEMLMEQIRRSISLEKNHFRFRHRRADGTAVEVEAHSGPITIGGKTYLLSVIIDISKRIAAEAERDELAARLSHYLSTSPTITYSLRLENGKAQWDWISENVAYILGYSLQEVLAPDWWFMNVAATDRAAALRGIAELTKAERYVQEYRFAKKNRSVLWLRDEMRLVKGEGGTLEIVGTLTDITERKHAEEEETLKSAALEAADNAVIITDRNGKIEWMNSSFEKLTGYSRAESKGKNPHDLVKSGKHDNSFYRTMWDTINAGRVWHGELVNKRKSGELYHEEMTITPVLDGSGRIEHFIAVKTDVTERTRSKEQLEASLREKEVLLREVHHRVKNNMQVISSLLNLSSETYDDPELLHSIDEVTRRIESMAIIHEQFYESNDVSHIDFPLYLRNLTSTLADDNIREQPRPELIFKLDEAKLNLNQAIPAGLIVSEFVSNSLRFAFRGSDHPGVLTVNMRSLSDHFLEIEVRDNGVGFPEGFDPQTSRSLGMLLVRILSEQLRGAVTYLFDGGTVAVLRFPLSAGS